MAQSVFLAVLAAMMWTAGALAHHPFSAEFDSSQSVTLVGTVTKVEWQNPHVYAYVESKDDQGKVINWKIEMGSPAELMKDGWTRTSLKAGDSVTVKGWKSKTNPALANADSFTVSGGKTMTAASSYYGAPSDQRARADSAGQQGTGTSGTQELPSTGSPLALYLLLGGLSLAGGLGLRRSRR